MQTFRRAIIRRQALPVNFAAPPDNLNPTHGNSIMPSTRRRSLIYLAALAAAPSLLVLAGCGDTAKTDGGDTKGGAGGKAAGGGEANPRKLVFGFVPSVEANKIAKDAAPIAAYLSKSLGIPVETYTATQYNGLIEAMGSGKADIGSLPPLAYVLASDRKYAQVLLKTSRHGSLTYHGMFITRADSGIKRIEDARGKRMAYVDQSSTSGYLMPAAYLKGKGLDPDGSEFFSNVVFAGSHDGAIRAVYSGDVDVACVYDDARNKVEKEAAYKDVKTRVVKIGQTDEIPNDTISVRNGLDPALVAKIKESLLQYAQTPDGKKVLNDVYEVDNIVEAKDSDYDPVRVVAKATGVNLSAVIDKPKASPAPAGSAAKASPAASKEVSLVFAPFRYACPRCRNACAL